MGSFSVWHWLIALAILLLLFGRGKIPELMGDVAKGIKNFRPGWRTVKAPQLRQPRIARLRKSCDVSELASPGDLKLLLRYPEHELRVADNGSHRSRPGR
ncbi:twin-arginine translocase TatA/TatE family subunit [Rhizobium tubonense]|uniref:Sec-independent protein translocase protein TatA n=1 Tax=Rhizobium tubonense TaxID=484088 RepID=A0A2W4ENC1_9HYPH|nr:hypothetical protein CPY51_08740 [Rhizobium tubonense]